MSITAVMDEFLPAVCEANQAALDARVDGALRKSSILLALASRYPAERTDRLIDAPHGINVEATLRYGIDDVLAQHEMLYVVRRDQHTLVAGELPLTTQVEEALDLLIDAADGLDMTVLIDRPGDSQRLVHGYLRQGRQQCAGFR